MEMFATITKETDKAYFVSFQTRSHHAEYPIVREFVLQAEQMWMPKSVVVAQTTKTITVAEWFLAKQTTLRLAYTPAHAAEDATMAAKMAAITAKYAVVTPVAEAEAAEIVVAQPTAAVIAAAQKSVGMTAPLNAAEGKAMAVQLIENALTSSNRYDVALTIVDGIVRSGERTAAQLAATASYLNVDGAILVRAQDLALVWRM